MLAPRMRKVLPLIDWSERSRQTPLPPAAPNTQPPSPPVSGSRLISKLSGKLLRSLTSSRPNVSTVSNTWAFRP